MVVFFIDAQHGLFVSTTQTVFTRTLVDVVAPMLSGRNSFSRQTITAVIHRYSRTLIRPSS